MTIDLNETEFLWKFLYRTNQLFIYLSSLFTLMEKKRKEKILFFFECTCVLYQVRLVSVACSR
jgi:hypothetical protein